MWQPGERKMNPPRKKIKILFLGQCIAQGYGIGAANSYPQLVQQMLSTQFPTLRFELKFNPLLHPTGLKALLANCLPQQPDIIFISLPAIFAAIPFQVNSLYLIAPEIMQVAHSFALQIQARLRQDSTLAKLFSKRSVFQPIKRCAPVTCTEYKRLIEDAIRFCQQASTCRLILMGPGGFNEDNRTGELQSPVLGNEINRMILAVGQELGVTVVNAQDWMTSQGGKVFFPGDNRWNQIGHQIMAREIQSIVAKQVRQLLTATQNNAYISR
jgi:hypothetical protein